MLKMLKILIKTENDTIKIELNKNEKKKENNK